MLQSVWKRIGAILLVSIMMVGVVQCICSLSNDISDTFLEEEHIQSFYGRGIQTESINGRIVSQIDFNEWKKGDSKYRLDTIVQIEKGALDIMDNQSQEVKDQTQELTEDEAHTKNEMDVEHQQMIFVDNCLYLLYPDKEEYYKKKSTLSDAVSESFAAGIDQLIDNGSAKEYTMQYLSSLTQNFNVQIEDDVKINGRNTQHIIAEGKTQDYIGIKEEVWIDQKTWLIIKVRDEQENYVSEFEYIDFQINPKCKDTIFELPLSEGTKIEELQEDLYKVNKNIEIDEISEYVPYSCYGLLDVSGVTLSSIKYTETVGEPVGTISMVYETEDNEQINISNMPLYNIQSEVDSSGEKIQIGYFDAVYYEYSNYKMIRILHKNMICSIWVMNDTISKDELVEYAKLLKLIKN